MASRSCPLNVHVPQRGKHGVCYRRSARNPSIFIFPFAFTVSSVLSLYTFLTFAIFLRFLLRLLSFTYILIYSTISFAQSPLAQQPSLFSSLLFSCNNNIPPSNFIKKSKESPCSAACSQQSFQRRKNKKTTTTETRKRCLYGKRRYQNRPPVTCEAQQNDAMGKQEKGKERINK